MSESLEGLWLDPGRNELQAAGRSSLCHCKSKYITSAVGCQDPQGGEVEVIADELSLFSVEIFGGLG